MPLCRLSSENGLEWLKLFRLNALICIAMLSDVDYNKKEIEAMKYFVYVLKAIDSDFRYVGVSVNVKKRISLHRKLISEDKHQNKRIQMFLNRGFITETIIEFSDKSKAYEKEYEIAEYYYPMSCNMSDLKTGERGVSFNLRDDVLDFISKFSSKLHLKIVRFVE